MVEEEGTQGPLKLKIRDGHVIIDNDGASFCMEKYVSLHF